MKKEKEIWIGLAEVNPLPGSDVLGSEKRAACVNVVAFASDQMDFDRQLQIALIPLNLGLVSLEDLEPLSVRKTKHHVDKYLIKLAKKINENNPLEFGKFHTFPLVVNFPH